MLSRSFAAKVKHPILLRLTSKQQNNEHQKILKGIIKYHKTDAKDGKGKQLE